MCHTVIPDGPADPDAITYEAESPDEEALLVAAKKMGFFFHKRRVLGNCGGGGGCFPANLSSLHMSC